MEENQNQENEQVNNEVEEEEVVTTTEYIDYSDDITDIKSNLQGINSSITFITLLLILWCILSNFVFKKGWTR